MLIVFEGIDGSGKTTISELVHTKLEAKIPQVRYCKKSSPDFGHPYVRNQMYKLQELIWPPDVPIENIFGDLYWLFLNAAWFSVVQNNRIKPLQSQQHLIVHDGWYYRLIARFTNKGFEREWLLSLFATINDPDIVVMLDIDPHIAWERRTNFKPNEMGGWDGYTGNASKAYCRYQESTRQELLRFAREKSWFVVSQNYETTTEEICNVIYEYILSKFTGIF